MHSAIQSFFSTLVPKSHQTQLTGQAPMEPPEREKNPAAVTLGSIAQCMGAKKAVITGRPNFDHVSTSYVERQNLSLRIEQP